MGNKSMLPTENLWPKHPQFSGLPLQIIENHVSNSLRKIQIIESHGFRSSLIKISTTTMVSFLGSHGPAVRR